MTTLEYRTNNAYDTVILIIDGEVRSEWTVTPEVLKQFCDCSFSADDWDDNQGTDCAPGGYGERMATRIGYTLEAADAEEWANRVEAVCH